jgi:hypothetical protein
MVLYCILLASAGAPLAGETNVSIEIETGYKTNVYIPVDSTTDSSRAAFRNCPFLAGASVPSYSFLAGRNWKSSLSCDLSAAWYVKTYAAAHVLPGISFIGDYTHNVLTFDACGGYSMQPPDEQDPNRPAQSGQFDLGAVYFAKFRNKLELGYTFSLLQDIATVRHDLRHSLKVKGTLNVSPAFRLFCKIGMTSNNSTDSSSRFIGWMALPGIIFTAGEKNTVITSFIFNRQFYKDTSTIYVKKNQTDPGPGDKFMVLVPHSQQTSYYCAAFSYVRELSPALDFSAQYAFSLFSPGDAMQDITSHRMSVELSWAMRPL